MKVAIKKIFTFWNVLALVFLMASMVTNPLFHSATHNYVEIMGYYFPRLFFSVTTGQVGSFVLVLRLVYRSQSRLQKYLFSLIALVYVLVMAVNIPRSLAMIVHFTSPPEAFHGTPLMKAAYHGNLKEVQDLLTKGASVQEANDLGMTALHFAGGAGPVINQPFEGSTEVARYLLDHGADPSARSSNGITPLIDAVENDHLETVKLLIERGADVNWVSPSGLSALSAARAYHHEEVEKVLIRAGAHANP